MHGLGFLGNSLEIFDTSNGGNYPEVILEQMNKVL